MRQASRYHVAETYGWDVVFDDLFKSGRRSGDARRASDPAAAYADILAVDETPTL
jgi:hypothetical protein